MALSTIANIRKTCNFRCKLLICNILTTPPNLTPYKSSTYCRQVLTKLTSLPLMATRHFAVCLVLAPLLLAACYSASDEAASALQPFYAESQNLCATSLDSVCSFAEKFYGFTRSGDYDDDPLYVPIVNNINVGKAYFTPFFTIDTAWGGTIHVDF